ncbi:Leucine carboxyl methyltransferase [Trichinella pseudospiralis]
MFSKVPWYCPVLLSGSAPNGAIQRFVANSIKSHSNVITNSWTKYRIEKIRIKRRFFDMLLQFCRLRSCFLRGRFPIILSTALWFSTRNICTGFF